MSIRKTKTEYTKGNKKFKNLNFMDFFDFYL